MKKDIRAAMWRTGCYSFGFLILCGFLSWSFLIFHTVAELFSFSVGLALFLVIWNVRHRLEHEFFVLLGMALLISGLLDFLHALTYPGMNLVPGVTPDAPVQLWITSRIIQALSIAIAPGFLRRPPLKDNIRRLILALHFIVGTVVAAVIYATDWFPVCFVEGEGLTAFKIGAEYGIIALLALGSYRILRNRSSFSRKILGLLNIYIFLIILSELCLTFFTGLFNLEIIVGVILKLASVILLYSAVFEIGVQRPMEMLFLEVAAREQSLVEKTVALEKALEEKDLLMREASHRIRNNFSSILTLMNLKAEEAATEDLKESYRDVVRRLQSMALVNDKLQIFRDVRYVDFSEYASSICDELLTAYRRSVTGVRVEYSLKPARVPVDKAVVLGMILSELVTNTLKHAFPPGFAQAKILKIRFGLRNGRYRMEVQDNGVGIRKDFHPDEIGFLGHRILPALARQIDAEILFTNENGTCCIVSFPKDGIVEFEPPGAVPDRRANK